MPHRTAQRAAKAKELFGSFIPRDPVRRRSSRAFGRTTVCECRFKGELRTSAPSPATFVGGERCGRPAACGMASRLRVPGLAGRPCHFGIARTLFLSRFGARAIGAATTDRFGRANCRRLRHRNNRLILLRSPSAQGFQIVKPKPGLAPSRHTFGAPYARPRAARIVASKRVEMMSERRQSARRRAYLGGRASYEKPVSSDECLVRDRSPGGARLGILRLDADSRRLRPHDPRERRNAARARRLARRNAGWRRL